MATTRTTTTTKRATTTITVADGCPKNGKRKLNTINKPSKNRRYAVRCCNSKMRKYCVTPEPCKRLAFVEAQQLCVSQGRRLCTKDELAEDKCCETGCNFDEELTWSATRMSK